MRVEVIKEVNINLQGKEVDILWNILKEYQEDNIISTTEIYTVVDTMLTLMSPLVQNPR
jgi:hypothetical protein